jgi:hypothetical protein
MQEKNSFAFDQQALVCSTRLTNFESQTMGKGANISAFTEN